MYYRGGHQSCLWIPASNPLSYFCKATLFFPSCKAKRWKFLHYSPTLAARVQTSNPPSGSQKLPLGPCIRSRCQDRGISRVHLLWHHLKPGRLWFLSIPPSWFSTISLNSFFLCAMVGIKLFLPSPHIYWNFLQVHPWSRSLYVSTDLCIPCKFPA